MWSERTPLLSGHPEEETRARQAPHHPLSRIIALLLMSFIGFGAFFCYDNPGALQEEIKTALNLTTSEFTSLYSCYSWPNVILPVIGGFLIDSVFGLRLGTIIFAVFILLGQILLSIGAFQQSLWFMDLARFCFGIGGESLNMALNTYTVSWFKGKELNMVFGFQLSISRVGSTVNFLVVGPLYHLLDLNLDSVSALGWTLATAALLTLTSLACSLLLAILDRRRERSGLTSVTSSDQTIKLTDIKEFPATFWLLCLATTAYYGSVFPFISLGQALFRTEYGYSGQQANFLIGLVYLVSAIASPLFGLILDKFGKNLSWLCGSLLVSILAHAGLVLTITGPYIPIVIIGLAYSVLASALWSLPAVIVKDSQLATAFGIMQGLQNLGTAVITLAAGSIVDQLGYFWLEIFFLAWLCLALACGLAIWTRDYSTGGVLNRSARGENNNTEIIASYEALT